MGKRKAKQQELWVSSQEIPKAASHPFYAKVNEVLEQHKVDQRLEHLCRRFYKPTFGRPSIAPGVYFRLLLIGFFEGIDSERGIAWRVADSLSLREFLGFSVTEQTPDHSTISRTRRLLPVETHKAVFGWFVRVLGEEGLIAGQTIAIDATTLEASAAMRSIRRRDNGKKYEEYLTELAQAEGIEKPTREQLARLDRKRKKKGSNKEWKSPTDPDARIAKMKDGRTHLAHKAEHAVDLSSGAVVAVTLQAADLGDTTTLPATLQEAQVNAALVNERGVEETVADKGYHSNQVLVDLHAQSIRSYLPEPERGPRNWDGKEKEQKQVYANRRRMGGRRGKDLQKLRSELVERSFAHMYETGGMRRTHLRKRNNILKRLLFHAVGFNLALLVRKSYGIGKPRTLQGVSDAILLMRIALAALCAAWMESPATAEPVLESLHISDNAPAGDPFSDFYPRLLASTYAMNYGPLQWKRDALNFDLLNIGDWLAKAAKTQDDLDFYELCVSYVSSLDDAHDVFVLPSDFQASLGFTADYYDGKVIIDAVGRNVRGRGFQVGDELISIDGVPAANLVKSLSKYAVAANPRSTQRFAADYLTFRDQVLMPHAHQIPDTSNVMIKLQQGDVQSFTIQWAKTGTPITIVGPVISPHSSAAEAVRQSDSPDVPDPLRHLKPLRNMRVQSHKEVVGFGATAPVFQLPTGFVLRAGSSQFDFFYSGTYQAQGHIIGYLRIPAFDFLPTDELQSEIDYMQQSTDGLIVDIMHNPGGDGCVAEDLLSRLIPQPFHTVGLEIRATFFWVQAYTQALQDAIDFGAPDDEVARLRDLLQQVTAAYLSPSGRTGPLPVCQSTLDLQPATDPKRGNIAYNKPILLLVDELSASAADLFAAVMQDNQRAILVGFRTMGAGGNVDVFPATTYSYGSAYVTESLMHRLNPVTTAEYPTAPYVENIGVRPDVVLDYMTIDNLLNHGATFVQAFTDTMVKYLDTGSVGMNASALQAITVR